MMASSQSVNMPNSKGFLIDKLFAFFKQSMPAIVSDFELAVLIFISFGKPTSEGITF